MPSDRGRGYGSFRESWEWKAILVTVSVVNLILLVVLVIR